MCCMVVFFFFKQKTAYEMRISDWSSDVCSSDLRDLPRLVRELGELLRDLKPDVVVVHHLNWFGVELLALLRRVRPKARVVFVAHDLYLVCPNDGLKIGRASCRERVCQYV